MTSSSSAMSTWDEEDGTGSVRDCTLDWRFDSSPVTNISHPTLRRRL
jgi:hypothetical protein